jgi:predicted dehydrogenase
MLRMGIVGTGGIANAHAAAAAAVEGVELVAVADVSAAAATAFASTHGVPEWYGGVDELTAAEQLDIVSVCTWGNFHEAVTCALAESGRVRAILCEKPISLNAAECERMVAAAAANDVLLAEAFKFRHHPQFLKLKELSDAGAVGEVRTLRTTFTTGGRRARDTFRPEMDWRFDPQRGGGALYDLGCYCLHAVRFIVGSEPLCAFAVADYHEICGVDFQDAIVLQFPGGVTAQITIDFGLDRSQEFEVLGTTGSLRADRAWNNEGHAVSVDATMPDGVRARYDFPETDQFHLQLRHMADCLLNGTTHRISPADSIGQMRATDAIFASMKSGQPEPLSAL